MRILNTIQYTDYCVYSTTSKWFMQYTRIPKFYTLVYFWNVRIRISGRPSRRQFLNSWREFNAVASALISGIRVICPRCDSFCWMYISDCIFWRLLLLSVFPWECQNFKQGFVRIWNTKLNFMFYMSYFKWGHIELNLNLSWGQPILQDKCLD